MFEDYAKYYNLLYQDKNYAEETDFVLGLLTNDNRALHSLLDLGCGTGPVSYTHLTLPTT